VIADVSTAVNELPADSIARHVRTTASLLQSWDLETVVFARAVRADLEHRVLAYGRKTVVFA
jgi:formyltetrahydrofolate hydrolase